MILKVYFVLGLLCFASVASGVINTRKYEKMKVASLPSATSSSTKYDSLIQCIAGSSAGGTVPNGMQYSSESDLCNAHELSVSTLFDAVFHPDDNTESVFVPIDCVPQSCKNGELHFPPASSIFIPLTSNAPSTTFEGSYYDGGSTTAAATFSMTKSWSEQFWDGRYPLWHTASQANPHKFQLTNRKTFESISIFLWIYIDTTDTFSKNMPLISAAELPAKTRVISLVVTTDNRLSLGLFTGSATTFVGSNDAIIQRRVWQHVGAVFNKETESGQTYLNGSPIETFTSGGSNAEAMHVDEIEILGRKTHTDFIFVCKECASIYHELYNRALTDEEAQEVYLRPFKCPPPTCPQPIVP